MTPKEGETTRDRVTKKQSGMIEFRVTKINMTDCVRYVFNFAIFWISYLTVIQSCLLSILEKGFIYIAIIASKR